MSNKFTPGPWSIHKNIGKKTEMGIVASAAPCIVAIMGNQREWPEEAEANACLIAAAPDMLKALEKAEQNMKQLCQMVCTLSGNPKKVRLDDFAEEVRAAIAKAKGVQS